MFTSTEPVEGTAAGGLSILNLWGTGDDGATVDNDPTESPVPFPYFPDSSGHGTRFIVVHMPPEGAGDDSGDTDLENAQPGISHVFEPDNPGMHTSDTVDYGICLTGEVVLELDDGAEQRITPGTAVVQRGTRHRWVNRGTEVATLAFVVVAAQRD
ncbi:MAG TPA: cupin domain-containing protein [Pseudonocardia sp.]|nr:cupin domain-containing protein [Pseudonocardia sp.]